MENRVLEQQLKQSAQVQTIPADLNRLPLFNSEVSQKADFAIESIKEGDYAKAVDDLENLRDYCLNKLNSINEADLQAFEKVSEMFQRTVLRLSAEVKLVKGKKLVEEGHWQYGLMTLQNALEEFRELNDLDGTARAFLEIGTVQELFGDYEVAKLSFLDAERFFKKSKREEGIAVAELKLGTLALELYDYEKARKHLKLAADFFHQHGDQKRAELSDKFLSLADQYEHELAPI